MIHHTKFDVKPYSNKRKETQVDLRKTTGNQIIEMRRKKYGFSAEEEILQCPY